MSIFNHYQSRYELKKQEEEIEKIFKLLNLKGTLLVSTELYDGKNFKNGSCSLRISEDLVYASEVINR